MNQRAWKNVIGCTTPFPTTLRFQTSNFKTSSPLLSMWSLPLASRLVHVVPSCLPHCAPLLPQIVQPVRLRPISPNLIQTSHMSCPTSMAETLSISFSFSSLLAAPQHVSTCICVYLNLHGGLVFFSITGPRLPKPPQKYSKPSIGYCSGPKENLEVHQGFFFNFHSVQGVCCSGVEGGCPTFLGPCTIVTMSYL